MLHKKLKYSDMPLDRSGVLRNDIEWVKAQLAKTDAVILPLHNNKNLIKMNDGYPYIVYQDKSGFLVKTDAEPIFLGLRDETPMFALDVSHLEETAILDKPDSGEFMDLRQVGPLFNAHDAALLGYARAMVYWHHHNQYCGKCGAETTVKSGGHMRVCSETSCGYQLFPRTDPAVIMLVERKGESGEPNRCLLGSSGRFAKNAYSTLAGFVDPGESLEEAVAREVYEEAGIHVKNVKYITSQPWPFPASIMLGFHAEAISFDISCDNDELIDARWFTVDEILSSGEWGDEDDRFKLPRKDSISRYLIDQWLEKMQVSYKKSRLTNRC